MTPSEFGRWYRGLEQLTPDQADMAARAALRHAGDTGAQFATLARLVHTLLRTGHPDLHTRSWRGLAGDIDMRLRQADIAARREAS